MRVAKGRRRGKGGDVANVERERRELEKSGLLVMRDRLAQHGEHTGS